jgi:sigma-B regulation protein RsbU (phosphoserine phosphatase)
VGQTRFYKHDARSLPGVAEQLKVLQEDLEVARRIQNRLLPAPPVLPGYDIATVYQPAGEVGGDFYDFIPLDAARTAILIADASGKGLAGALLMVEARAMLRAIAPMHRSPREILVDVNRVLLGDLDRGMFVSIYLAILDLGRHVLTAASAGHTPMLVYRARGGTVERYAPPGPVLGAAKQAMFTGLMREEQVRLEPGDRFLLFTDGASELMNPVQVEYGMEPIERLMHKTPGKTSAEFLRKLEADLELHRAGQPPSDDITLVAVTRG